MTRRDDRYIDIPAITVYCDDPVHAEKRNVVARFGKYPPGVFAGGEGWKLLSDWNEYQFDDASPNGRRRRFVDEAVTVDGRTLYNLKCDKCARHGNWGGGAANRCGPCRSARTNCSRFAKTSLPPASHR
jgi:hypothetical protein